MGAASKVYIWPEVADGLLPLSVVEQHDHLKPRHSQGPALRTSKGARYTKMELL